MHGLRLRRALRSRKCIRSWNRQARGISIAITANGDLIEGGAWLFKPKPE
jgi:hypothetical protein